MKKTWKNPVMLEGGLIPGDDEVVGGGSGQSSPDIIPYSYEMWGVIFIDFPELYDSDGNGDGGTWADYVKWMTDNGFAEFIDPDENPEP
ncbi:MAG: hypothetical protein IJI66_14370 [Erysipelotrichaceae bacterium]|nr:hypothetical protein [Clostridia bacterium]MBQ6217778.1 hypothetical protein [Erysipelotrichaceae bacterium]MBR0420343.1 hypothetical protein [Erysipelotrichaceae bacterium]